MSQQVRWYDYPPEEDSWEAEENIFDTKLIRAFEASFKGARTAPAAGRGALTPAADTGQIFLSELRRPKPSGFPGVDAERYPRCVQLADTPAERAQGSHQLLLGTLVHARHTT